MITITIKTASLLNDIRTKSYMSTSRIKDPEEQYGVRVGEENERELMQDLQDAWRTLVAICRRFLQVTNDTEGADTLITTTADKTLTFDVTKRRSSNFGDQLAQAIHAYLVDGTLRRFYTSAAREDYMKLYVALENADEALVRKLIYKKQTPIHPDDEIWEAEV